ncbi:hypothetical protein DFJ73DRAFT_772250 [Zopfochytrium polystomum]|nr:hypothetical protein DFJ73DRAFT_772250 [Zopfochytrium polystomum]
MTGAVVDGYGRPLCSKCKTKAPDLSPSDGVAQTSRRRSRQSSSSSTRPSRSTASANSAPTNGGVRRSLRISQKRTADDAENGDSTESASEVEISSGKAPRRGRISPTNTQSTETTTESRHSHDNDDDDDDDDEVDQEFEEYRQRKQQEKMQRELPGEDVSRKRPRRGPHPAEEGEHGPVGHSTGVTSAPANNGVPVQQPGYSAIYTPGPAPGAGTPVPVPPSDGSTSQPYYLVWVPQNQTSAAGSDAGNQRRPSNGQEAAAQGMWYRMDAPPATYTGEHAPTVATAVPWSGPGTAQGAQGVSVPAYATVAVSHGVDPSRPPHNMHQQHRQPLSHHSQQMQHHFQTQSHHLQLLSASAPHQSHDGIHVGTEDESGEDSDEDVGQEGHEDVDQNTEVSHMAELRRGSSTRSPSGFTVDALAAAAAAAAMDEAEAAAAAEAASAAAGASTS